ncbi:MAG: hypothetical protein ACYCO0_05235 [Candidatus Micrarchaeaceae archaeon]
MTNARYARGEVTGDERRPSLIGALRDRFSTPLRYAALPILLAGTTAYSIFGYAIPSTAHATKTEQSATAALASAIRKADQTGNEQLIHVVDYVSGNSFGGNVLISPSSSSGAKQLAEIVLSKFDTGYYNSYYNSNSNSPLGYVNSNPVASLLNQSSGGAIVAYLNAQQNAENASKLPIMPAGLFILSAAIQFAIYYNR